MSKNEFELGKHYTFDLNNWVKYVENRLSSCEIENKGIIPTLFDEAMVEKIEFIKSPLFHKITKYEITLLVLKSEEHSTYNRLKVGSKAVLSFEENSLSLDGFKIFKKIDEKEKFSLE